MGDDDLEEEVWVAGSECHEKDVNAVLRGFQKREEQLPAGTPSRYFEFWRIVVGPWRIVITCHSDT